MVRSLRRAATPSRRTRRWARGTGIRRPAECAGHEGDAHLRSNVTIRWRAALPDCLAAHRAQRPAQCANSLPLLPRRQSKARARRGGRRAAPARNGGQCQRLWPALRRGRVVRPHHGRDPPGARRARRRRFDRRRAHERPRPGLRVGARRRPSGPSLPASVRAADRYAQRSTFSVACVATRCSLLEGGLRVPLWVRWPGHGPSLRVSTATTGTVDYVRTLSAHASRAGASPRRPWTAPTSSAEWLGASLPPARTGRNVLVANTPVEVAIRIGDQKALFQLQNRLCWWGQAVPFTEKCFGALSLYNLSADPMERDNRLLVSSSAGEARCMFQALLRTVNSASPPRFFDECAH